MVFIRLIAVVALFASTANAQQTLEELIAAPVPTDGTSVVVNGGHYAYDADSTEPPDQALVVCPFANSTLVEGVFRIDGRSLGHAQILLGTMQGDRPADSSQPFGISDWELHGHGKGSAFAFQDNEPFINHARGDTRNLDGGWPYEGSYRYASKPGRWMRALAPGAPFQLSMLGSLDGINDWHKVAWAINYADRLGRDLLVDVPTVVIRGGPLIIRDGMHMRGLGKHKTRFEVDADYFVDLYRTDKGWLSPGRYRGYKDRLFQWVFTGIWQDNRCHYFELSDFTWDGNASEAPWDEIQQDTEEWKWARQALGGNTQNAPIWSGVQATNQSGRIVHEDMHWTLENVSFIDCGSAIYLEAPQEIVARHTRPYHKTSGLTLGNSIGNHHAYHFSGQHTDVEMFGYSGGHAVHIFSPSNVNGWKYANGGTSPWVRLPQNAYVIGNWTNSDELVTITGIDWDLSESDYKQAYLIGGSCYLQGRIKGKPGLLNHWTLKPVSLNWQAPRGQVREYVKIELQTENCGTPELAHSGFRSLDYTQIDETPADPDAPDLAEVLPIRLSANWQGDFPDDHRQELRIHYVSDRRIWVPLMFLDLGEDSRGGTGRVTPTQAVVSGRFNNVMDWPVSTRRGQAAAGNWGDRPEMSVVFRDAEFARPFRADCVPSWVRFENCRLFDGSADVVQ